MELSAPHALTVETGGDAVPIAPPEPELSWQLPPELALQTGFELEARVDGALLEHGEQSGQHRFVAWPWAALRSCAEVSWRVRVAGSDGWSAWSGWAVFEAGLFAEDSTAEWISPDEPAALPAGARPAYRLTTSFSLDEVPPRARLYASALGVYEALVNGRRVGEAELAPGSESYDRTVYAQSFDITDLLHEGANDLVLVLSDGWYRGKAGTFRHQAAWGTRTAVRAGVLVGRGSEVVPIVRTGPHWTVRGSTIRQADLMDGQITDLTFVDHDASPAVPGPSDAPEPSWSPAPPVRRIEQLSPVGIARIADDTVVVDFGQNASGWVTLRSLGPRGTRTTLDFGEHLDQSGDLTTAHLDLVAPDGTAHVFSQHDEVVSDGDPDSVFEPRHTIHGFRYARVRRPGIALQPEDIQMQVVHTDLQRVGGFACSEPDLVRLWDVADWSFRGNAVDVPTDCPTRERAGWTGDWEIFLPTATRLYDVDGFSRKWLQSVRDDQLDDGRIVNISPDNARLRLVPDAMSDMATGSAGWGDAVVLVPWELYRTYGDRRVLEETWDAMVRWVEFALRAAAEHRHPSRVERSTEPLAHERYIWDGTFHFGEWLEPTPLAEDGTPGPTMPDPIAWMMADKGEVGTAYLYRSVSTLAHVAAVLGHADESASYSATAAQVKAAWLTEFLNSDGSTTAGTQAAYVRAIAFDLVPAELVGAASNHLVDLVRAAGTHLGTGFLSTADLLPVLADTGHVDVAQELLLQRTSPSWLGMLDRGATTIWEEWEGVDRNGRASASLNHYSKGAVVGYLHTHLLGLQQAEDSVAWEQVVIAPTVPAGLTWARGHFNGPQGRIEVDWHADDQHSTLQVLIPGGTTARLRWDGQEHRVGPGRHVLSSANDQHATAVTR